MEQTRYEVETKTIKIGGKPATLISRTPVLTPSQREMRRKEIEARLYDVCRKHLAAAN